jgi:hypothetical protein
MLEAKNSPKWTKPTMTIFAQQQVQGKIRIGPDLVEGHRPPNGTSYHFAGLSARTSDVEAWGGGGNSRVVPDLQWGPTGSAPS